MKIHPTAIIDSDANLHESVEVGPYSIIEGDVTIGEGTTLGGNVWIGSGTTIGKFNTISRNAVLGGLPQDLGFDPSLKTKLIIGDNNVFREFTNIHRSTKIEEATRIGDNNFLMGSVHFGHDCIVGNNNIFTQGCIMAGHVHVANRAFVSGLVAIHQFVSIGEFAMIAGLAKITKDVPPYCTADGNPAVIIGQNSVGMRRGGLTKEQRDSIRQAYRVIYHSHMVTSVAIESLKRESPSAEVQKIIEFVENSKRGITDHQ